MTIGTGGVISPTTDGERFELMDVLRGVALCGILLMNIPWMGQYMAYAKLNTPPLPTAWNPGWITWWVQEMFFAGTMRGLFTLLFGAGMVLMTMRGDREHGPVSIADVYLRRCAALILLGIVNFTLLAWPGDILYFYGFAAIALFMFRRLRPRTLFILAGLMIVLATAGLGAGLHQQAAGYAQGELAVAAQARGETLTEAQEKSVEDYNKARERLYPKPETLAEERERRGDYLSAIGWSAQTWAKFGLTPFLIFGVLESVCFMFIGVGLFKLGVLTGQRPLSFYVVMAAISYAIGLGINAWEQITLWNAGFDPKVWLPHVTYQFGRLAMTLGHVGLVGVLWKLNVLGFVGAGLKAIGKMALSNYLGQSLITSVLFYGFGLFARFDWAQLWALAAIIWVVQAILSLIWLRFFRMGPMEWLLRCFAYARWQSIR